MTYRDDRPSPRSAIRALWPPIAVVAVALLLAGCGKHSTEVEAARPVIALPVEAVAAAPSLQFPGEVHARYEMPLSFRVAGQLTTREVRLGDTVKKGQLLARLDDTDAVHSQTSAQAALQAAQHRFDFATQQRDRDEAQARQNLISQLQLEQTHDAYVSALAARDQAAQQLALARSQAGYTSLVADRDGSITSEQAEVGQVLAAGQSVFGFAWSGERDVFFDVPEDRLGSIAVGQAASVSLPVLPGQSFAGHVRDIAPAADAQARTYRIKLALDAPGPQLHLGMTAEVLLPGQAGAGQAIRLPATALFHQGERPAVWVVGPTDAKLELRPVSILRYGEREVLVATGLKPGERVVMQGVHTVSAGEKVVAIAPPHAEDAPQ